MMKSMSENSNGSNSNTSSSNWLGFSLYPHIKMEVAPSSSPLDVEASNSMFISPLQHLTCSPAQCFSGYDEATDQHGLAANSSSSPKLENFLGAADHEREAMALSLDSIYYPQNGHNPQEANGQSHSFDIFQHHQPFYGDGDGDDLFQAPLVEPGEQKGAADISDCSAQISEMANWVTISTMADNGGSSPASGSIASVACGDLQSLTLSMSPGCQSSCVTPVAHISPSPADCLTMGTKKRGFGKVGQKLPAHRKSIDTFGQRTSQYRGVTKHRWTGRYEAHLWDNSCKKEGQTRKGRQVYLGGYDMEDKAARAYDLAALKYWGPSTHTNFPVENYKDQLEEMNNMTRQEYVAHLRRKSSGFSRGASMYRGVTRHHQHGRWQARIGRVAGNKDLYLGTFSAQEEAAEAYDIAAIKFRGVSAVTNFDMSRYDVEKIMSSNTLLAGEQAKRIKALEPSNNAIDANPISSSQLVLCDYPHQEEQNNYSVALHNLIGTHSLNSTMVDECNKMASVQVSNASSIVTSLNSSREGSPDKSGSSSNIMVIQKPPNVGWISPAQLRPATAIPMAYLPVFAAWNDA